jgi:AraC-like DNA-binding protein
MLLGPHVFRRLCRARELLVAARDDAPSIEAVARVVAISSSHFTRQFAALFGATPHQLRLRARLERAKGLLAAGRSVTEVCLEVGFSSLGSFSELFRRRVGTPPSAYRRRAPAPGAPIPGCLGLMSGLPPDAFRSFREAPSAPACDSDHP